MSKTESRWVGTCEVCGGEVHQRWVTTPATGGAGPIEQPVDAAACSVDREHAWQGSAAR